MGKYREFFRDILFSLCFLVIIISLFAVFFSQLENDNTRNKLKVAIEELNCRPEGYLSKEMYIKTPADIERRLEALEIRLNSLESDLNKPKKLDKKRK